MNSHKITYAISGLYIGVISIFMLWHRAWVSMDQFFAIAIVIALLLGRLQAFIFDWVPMIILYLSYEYLRGLVPLLNNSVHIWPMIKFDQFLFGTVPSLQLQHLLFTPNTLHWYDYLFVIFYMCHFIAPMIVGFYFWLTDKKLFKDYSIGFIVLSYAGFLTYIIFPAMPPWMASLHGYIPQLDNITDQVMGNFAQPLHLPSVYHFIKSNEVAAMPSLHAAYPLLIFLFLYRKLRVKSFLILPYVLGVWIAVLYLGEHYFADVLFGILYAVATFWLVTHPTHITKYLVPVRDVITAKLPQLRPRRQSIES